MAPNAELLLKDLRLYADFSDDDFSLFLKLFTPISLKKHEFFYTQGTVPKHSPFITRGCMRQYFINDAGEEKIVRFIQEGAWAGQVGSMRNNLPTNLNLQALEDCDALGITLENIDRGFQQFPNYQKYFVTKYPLDHGLMIEEAARLSTEPPEASYLRLLKESPSLLNRVPQHYIANYLNIRPETLSRIRNKISRSNLS